MHAVTLPSGERVPSFGLGTWQIGDDPNTRPEEIATLRLGLDLGATLIDTAEMYGEGRSEQLIAEAIRGRRDQVFLVTKVYPHNASQQGQSYLRLYKFHSRSASFKSIWGIRKIRSCSSLTRLAVSRSVFCGPRGTGADRFA